MFLRKKLKKDTVYIAVEDTDDLYYSRYHKMIILYSDSKFGHIYILRIKPPIYEMHIMEYEGKVGDIIEHLKLYDFNVCHIEKFKDETLRDTVLEYIEIMKNKGGYVSET